MQERTVAAYENLPADVKARTSSAGLFQMFLLYTHYVATMDRNSFGRIGSEGQHFLHLSCASDLKVLEEGVRRLKVASSDREGFEKFMKTTASSVV